MKIAEILTQEQTACCVPSASKKRVLEYLSHFIADNVECIESDDLYQQFFSREKLGSTGIGSGVAIPHCRVCSCERIHGTLLKLESPVDFGAIDDKPVDLIFALVVPDEQNDEHLQTLSSIAELFQDPDNLQKLRSCESSQALFQAAISGQSGPAAG